MNRMDDILLYFGFYGFLWSIKVFLSMDFLFLNIPLIKNLNDSYHLY